MYILLLVYIYFCSTFILDYCPSRAYLFTNSFWNFYDFCVHCGPRVYLHYTTYHICYLFWGSAILLYLFSLFVKTQRCWQLPWINYLNNKTFVYGLIITEQHKWLCLFNSLKAMVHKQKVKPKTEVQEKMFNSKGPLQ